MASNANTDTEGLRFECTGCGYQLTGFKPATRVIIDCPNCNGETLCLPPEEI